MKVPIDVCLVCMPYCSPELPSLALGLLQAALLKEGIRAKSMYANLLFCEELGVDLYRRSQLGAPTLPIAEWSFASAAFPEHQADQEQFIEAVHAKLGQVYKKSVSDYRSELTLVRRKAEEFTLALAKRILEDSPRIVACTSSLAQKVPTLALLRKIRELSPGVITIVGGADCETLMGLTMHTHIPWVDYVISGEGEDIIAPLVGSILKFGRDVPQEELPEGAFAPVHRQTSYPAPNRQRAVARSFENQLTPNYDDYFTTLRELPFLGTHLRPSLPIQASRGCWYGQCKFCGLNAKEEPYRSRSAEAILDEMDELNSRYGVGHFQFLDNVLDMNHLKTLVPEFIDRQAPYKLFLEMRCNLSKEQMRVLRQAGFVWCQPGVESLHTSALQALRKGVSAWENIQTLKWCHQFGIHSAWAILHDFPGDQDSWYKDIADLIPYLVHLYPPRGVYNIQYHRNSHFADHSHQYGLDLIAIPLLSHVYPFENEVIANLSYTLQDRKRSQIADLGIALLFEGSGFRKMRKAVSDWGLAFQRNRPVLNMKVGKDEVVIHDTRPIAVQPLFRFIGLEREVYIECDRAIKETELYSRLINKGFAKCDIDKAVRVFVQNKLIIRIDQRLLALAVEGPEAEYLPQNQSPFGWIDQG